ncbi:hypothetical protein M153_7650002973 [Pseudoloma neurophilia]|uniref:Uncharacterized protein n=1 Tax=Pseudoloma neurophilia TaxID=146866 RepID=A0A0R0LW45_9MICR|nr:hypothetical protein M153_7650002973 [Pseudoloma neurophilia]
MQSSFPLKHNQSKQFNTFKNSNFTHKRNTIKNLYLLYTKGLDIKPLGYDSLTSNQRRKTIHTNLEYIANPIHTNSIPFEEMVLDLKLPKSGIMVKKKLYQLTSMSQDLFKFQKRFTNTRQTNNWNEKASIQILEYLIESEIYEQLIEGDTDTKLDYLFKLKYNEGACIAYSNHLKRTYLSQFHLVGEYIFSLKESKKNERH